MRNFLPIYRRELALAFGTPLAATLLVIYLALSGILTLTLGGFIEANSASLTAFFGWQPWLFLFLGAALGMGQWEEEYRRGAAELLLSLPVSLETMVAAKFLAGLTVLSLGLLETLPFAGVCAWLGTPDWGPVFTGYLGCLICAGFFLALGQAASACTSSPFASCLTAFTAGLAMLLAGFRPFNLLLVKWGFPDGLVETVAKLSITRHFEEFPRGVISFKSVYFFVALVLICLTAALLVLRRRHLPVERRRTGATLLLWALLACLLPLAERLSAKFDATAERLYTLDAGTRQVLGELDVPVVIDFYYSRHYPELTAPLRNHAARVEELMEEFTRAGHGLVTLRRHNPADEAQQQAARALGLQPHIGSMGDLWFLGAILTPEAEGHAAQLLADFPMADADQLEYQLARAVAATQRMVKRRIGLYSTLPVLEHFNPKTRHLLPTWHSMMELQRDFEVVPAPDLQKLPPELDLLMLVHPKKLLPEEENAVREFLANGGTLIALLDSLSRADMQLQGRFVPPQPSDLPDLLADWGIAFQTNKVVADRTLATPMTNAVRGVETLPTLITFAAAQLNGEHPLTAHLQNLMMFCPGYFQIEPKEGVAVTVLAQTTRDSQALEIYEAQRNAAQILTDFQPGKQEFPVVLLVEAPKARALLVGDVDYLHNSLCINNSGDEVGSQGGTSVSDNATLLTNAAEYLCADARLLRVRSRGRTARTFERLEALAHQTERRIQELDAQTYQQNEDLRQRMRELSTEEDQDSPEHQRKLREIEDEAERRQEQFRANQRQELRKLRHQLDCIERKVTLLCVLLCPALNILVACFVAWRRRV